jgi:hypothetical protein
MLLLALLVCSCSPAPVPITQPAPARLACSSALVVPAACPVYAPGDSDDNDEGSPYPDQITASCIVDDTGATYGTVLGDQGVGLPTIAGNREIGLYISFSPTHPAAIANLTVTGNSPTITAYAAPVNIDAYPYPTPDPDPANRISAYLVAVGPTGVLYTLGRFDTTKTQVDSDFHVSKVWPGETVTFGWNARFYVNGTP